MLKGNHIDNSSDKRETQKAALIFIFNHRYEQNVEKLRRIYQDRFSIMRFIVPFCDDNNEEIIPVYESSYYFEGFFMQAFDKLMVLDVDYYLFIADDLILNPEINEYNFREFFNLPDSKRCYINDINMLNSAGGIGWMHSMYSSLPFFSKGILWQRELPSYEDALKKFEEFFGEKYKEKYDEQFFYIRDDIDKVNTLIQTFYDNNNHSFDIPYPMAKGYSDVLILEKQCFKSFSRLCGVFSAMDIFAEIAIPSAIVLLFNRDEISCLMDTEYIARLLWFDYEYFATVANTYNHEFFNFYNNWNNNYLYVHPIKLSDWNV